MKLKLEVNGKAVSVSEGSTVMDAVREAEEYVPHFCYHPKLSVAANCRMCMVDIEKSPKALPACATPAADGMVVHTDSERAKKAQQAVMEFLLINHPLDCPICDQGGECQLQDLAVGYGISSSRYREEKRVVFEKNLGSLIATDMTRCIHCTRCVRFGVEVAGVMELGMIGRGEHSEIMPFIEKTVDSEISGNMIDLCPVGALTSKPFRFTARPWELNRHPAVGTHDSWGSHLIAQAKGNEIKRVLPNHDPGIYEHWISDRDRFAYEGLATADRCLSPQIRVPSERHSKDSTWQNALEYTAQHLKQTVNKHGAEKIAFFVSPRATCEEAYLLQHIARQLGCENIESRFWQRDFDGEDWSGLGLAGKDLSNLGACLFVGAEPPRELPLLAAWLRRRKRRFRTHVLSSVNLTDRIPVTRQILARPDGLADEMVRLVLAAGGELPQGWREEVDQPLFQEPDTPARIPQTIVKDLKKAGQGAVIWLGDIAQASPQYSLIKGLAKQLAELTGCRLGVLNDRANGVGMRRVGAVPGVPEVSTAKLLRADFQAMVLLGCEPSDFIEGGLMEQLLKKTPFICALTSHKKEFSGRASVLMPIADFAENEGSYLNGFGEMSVFTAAVSPPGQARPAWKVLRRLGEECGVSGVGFDTSEEVRAAWMDKPAVAPPSGEISWQSSAKGNYCLYGGVPAYGDDMLVRRAAALQATRSARKTGLAGLNPNDLRALGLAEGDDISFNGGEYQTTVYADADLAAGVVRCHSSRLSGAVVKLSPVTKSDERKKAV